MRIGYLHVATHVRCEAGAAISDTARERGDVIYEKLLCCLVRRDSQDVCHFYVDLFVFML